MALGPRTIFPASDIVSGTHDQANDGFEVHVFTVTTIAYQGSLEIKGRTNSGDWLPARFWLFNPGNLYSTGPYSGVIPLPTTGTRLVYITDPWRLFHLDKQQVSGSISVDYFPRDHDMGLFSSMLGGSGGGSRNTTFQQDPDSLHTTAHIWSSEGPLGEENPLLVALHDAVQIALAASEAHTGQVGGAVQVVYASAPIVRPADTTTYAAGDQVASSSAVNLIFPSPARIIGGSGWIIGAVMVSTNVPALKAQLDLYLNIRGFTMAADNAAAAPTTAELIGAALPGAILSGMPAVPIPFVNSYAFSANCLYVVTGLNLPFKCGADQNQLLGMAVMRNAYVPASAEQLTFALIVVPD